MEKWLLALTLLTLMCTVFLLLPVILVPVTGLRSNLYLSKYQNYLFGVFGICDLNSNNCSVARIGYPAINDSFYNVNDEYSVAELPLNIQLTISKLLVVHVVAFGISAVQFLLVVAMLVMQEVKGLLAKEEKSDDVSQPMLSGETAVDDSHLDKHDHHYYKRISYQQFAPFMDWMLVFSLLSFLTTLLAFLADILLFISNLSYVGWIQLFPIIAHALISTLVCFMKRLISTRKLLDDDHVYLNDDMRMRPQLVSNLDWDRSSDDGFTYNVGPDIPLRQFQRSDDSENISVALEAHPDDEHHVFYHNSLYHRSRQS